MTQENTKPLADGLIFNGIKEIRPTYGEISENRDYSGVVEITDSGGGIYRFFFRVWRSFGKTFIDSSGSVRYTDWQIPTLYPITARDEEAAAELLQKEHSFVFCCAIIEAVENHIAKENIAKETKP